MIGTHSRDLCGPADGLGAQTPPILSSIQCLGAFKRLRWRLAPLTPILALSARHEDLARL